jgi:protein SCO1/2
MAGALDQLEQANREKVQAVFITVDPERDTPAVMKDYVGAFEGANILGLTGTPIQVSAAEEEFHIRVLRFKHVNGDYTMSHSSKVFIIDPSGHLVTLVHPDHLAEHLARLLP